jgi:hypothetical protein
MTNPAVARKTPDHTNILNGAVIFMTYCPEKKDIVRNTLHKAKMTENIQTVRNRTLTLIEREDDTRS